MLAALLLASLPVVPDTDGVSAYFSVRHPEQFTAYEILVPKPDPLRGIMGARLWIDHETTIDIQASTDPGFTHPGGPYYITARYWFWPEPEQKGIPVDAFSITYNDVMPALGPGEAWEHTNSGSHPAQHLIHPYSLPHFMRRQGPVRLYLIPDASGDWPHSTHSFTWYHQVNYDLQAGRIEYQGLDGTWYVPG